MGNKERSLLVISVYKSEREYINDKSTQFRIADTDRRTLKTVDHDTLLNAITDGKVLIDNIIISGGLNKRKILLIETIGKQQTCRKGVGDK